MKIQEIWKALKIQNYPLKVQKHIINDDVATTRACTNGRLIESVKCKISQKSCINDAIRLWKQLPTEVTSCTTKGQIKTQTKIFVKTFPV